MTCSEGLKTSNWAESHTPGRSKDKLSKRGAGNSMSQEVGRIQATLLKPFLFLLSLLSLQYPPSQGSKGSQLVSHSTPCTPAWISTFLFSHLPLAPVGACSAVHQPGEGSYSPLPAPVLFHCSPSLVFCPCAPFLALQAPAQLQTFSLFQTHLSQSYLSTYMCLSGLFSYFRGYLQSFE